MDTIHFENQNFKANERDVLSVLLDAGLEVPHGCRSGSCQSCLMKASDGTPPENAQKGLKETLKAQSYFLACQCYPEEPLSIERPNAEETQYSSTLIEKQWLSHNVIQLKLQRPENFSFYAGQFVTLWKDKTLGRSYSIANLSSDDFLEFHIRVIANGRFSTWAAETANIGNELQIQGPAGDCFYLDHDLDQDLLLIGTGTGLAPLQGILQSALKAGHRGRIDLFHGGVNPAGLYQTEKLTTLAAQHGTFYYHPCVLDPEGDNALPYLQGDIKEAVLHTVTELKGKKIYLCGDPDLVKSLKTQLFLAGANSKDIYLDAFESSQ